MRVQLRRREGTRTHHFGSFIGFGVDSPPCLGSLAGVIFYCRSLPSRDHQVQMFVARANYLVADRQELMYATKELFRGMVKPTKAH